MTVNDSARFNRMIGKLEETASDLSNFLELIEDRSYSDGTYFIAKLKHHLKMNLENSLKVRLVIYTK